MSTKNDQTPSDLPKPPDEQAFADAAKAQVETPVVAEDVAMAEQISASIDLAFAKASGAKVH